MTDQIAFLVSNLANLLIGFPSQRPGGLALSILLACFGIGGGFMIGLLVGSGRSTSNRMVRWVCRLYVEVFRGIPLILLLLLVYQVFGGRWRGFALTPRGAAMIALALYSGAYQAEILHAGLQAVPQQYIEAARMVGSAGWQIFFWIRLRYALQVMVPAYTGQAISLFKDTSVVVVIGVADLMTVGRMVLGSDVRNLPYWVGLYLLVGLLYFVVSTGLSRIARRLERSKKKGDLVYSLSKF